MKRPLKWYFAVAIAAVVVFNVCNFAFGQITVNQDANIGEKIIASVDVQMPDGATFDGGWKSSDGVVVWQPTYTILGKDGKPAIRNTKEVAVFASKSGKHTLSFSGFWLLLKDVTFKDGDGNEITITSYLGHGFIDETAEFTVKGAVDPPDPPDPPTPTPGGKFQIMMFYDGDQLDDMPESQRQLLTSLTRRNQLEEKGHVVLEILEKASVDAAVAELYPAWIKAVKGDTFPRIALAPRDGGTVVDFPLPMNYDDLELLLNSADVKAFYRVREEGKS